VFCVSPGDWASGGANRLAQPGLVKRIIGGHWSAVPALYQLVAGNQVEGYNMPLGPMTHLYRDIAAGKPGHLSRVGLGTFADPRFGGGKLNEMTTEDLVELVAIGGEEYLFYKAFPVNVAIVRGTTADPAGNMTMEREALTCDTLSLAMAAHNSGGLVIAQVERLAEVNSLNPRQVKIPGALVDCIVVATDQENHPQTLGSHYSPAFAAEVRVPLTSLAPMPLSARKIIARRAAMELMAFKPIVTKTREMDRRIFRSDPMGLREDMLRLPLDARFTYDDERNILYLNFEDLQVKSMEVIEDVVAKIREICGPLGHKVYAVVNYDGFELDSDLEDAYLDAVQEIDDTYFHGVTPFTTSAFMRAKLGSALESRGVTPHIYESEAEAAGAVRTTLPRLE
jgi:acyl CoA:acetate/3-ketoacid CoA transferase